MKQRPEEEELIQNWRPFWEIEVPGNHKSSQKKIHEGKEFLMLKVCPKESWKAQLAELKNV